MHFVKVDDSRDDLPNEAFERGQISDLLLRQCVKVLLGISSFHQLQQDSILLFISSLLPDIEKVMNDIRVAELSTDLELPEHAREERSAKLFVVENLAQFDDTGNSLVLRFDLTEENFSLSA